MPGGLSSCELGSAVELCRVHAATRATLPGESEPLRVRGCVASRWAVSVAPGALDVRPTRRVLPGPGVVVFVELTSCAVELSCVDVS
jgi:hypothetical protein